MVKKEIIHASVDIKTADKVRKQAEKEKRSFSQMVDVLLQKAISIIKTKSL